MAIPRVELIPGLSMPAMGYGVGTAFFKGKRGEEVTMASVTMALDANVGHIDEAEMYQNETVTGTALRAWFEKSGKLRSDIFVTGKVLPSIDGPGPEGLWQDGIEASCRKSIERLGIDNFDLYLVHAPFNHGGGNAPFTRPLPEVWKQMEDLVSKGLTKAIGVSNWRIQDVEAVYPGATIKPCLNQIENHPHLRQPALIQYCQERGIAIASYSGLKPLTDQQLAEKRLMAEVVPRIAAAHGKTSAQILQRWNYQSAPEGRKLVITTTQQAERLQEYISDFDGSWQLSAVEMTEIDAAGDEHHHRAFWPKLDE